LNRIGVNTIVANVHYLAPMLTDWLSALAARPTLSFPMKPTSIARFGRRCRQGFAACSDPDPFLVLNADTFWLEDPGTGPDNLARMAELFDPAQMDIMMMTARPDQATGHTGSGDFTMDPEGRLARYRGTGDPVIYAGALVLSPHIFDSISEAKVLAQPLF
jgi:MurNAc alpha-1-phosphate uridylyltransferase